MKKKNDQEKSSKVDNSKSLIDDSKRIMANLKAQEEYRERIGYYHICPRCGRCPHCGRIYDDWPYYPRYPYTYWEWHPAQPYTITWTSSDVL